MNNEQLKILGINDTEAEVYLTVLKAGIVSHTEVANLSGIKRTTVYSAAKELVTRGLIAEDLSQKVARLTAIAPKNLTTILDNQLRQIEERKKLIQPLIEALNKEAGSTQYPVPKIQFITQEDISRFFFQQTPTWNESAKTVDSTWWGYQDPTFVENYLDWIEVFWKQPSAKEVYAKLLSNEADIEKVVTQHPQREIRPWASVKQFTATTWIVGDYVIMVVTNRSPHYLIEIHDPLMAHNLREFCKGVWNTLTTK